MLLISEVMLSVLMFVSVTSAMSPDVIHQDVKTQDPEVFLDEVASLKMERKSLLSQIEELKKLNDHLQSNQMNQERNSMVRSNHNSSGYPIDCADILLSGNTQSGIYEVYPFSCGCGDSISVFCDMETDGGGWTVFLNRENTGSQLNFNRSWTQYKNGFGSLSEEFWLGNDYLHELTSSRTYAMRMDFTIPSGSSKYILYDTFNVKDENSRYQLTLGSRASESTIPNNCYSISSGQYFYTYDRDQSRDCAGSGGGGFWYYYYCYIKYPPTGVYQGNYMNTTCYSNTHYQATNLQMKIRPSACESTYKKISYPGGYNCKKGSCGGGDGVSLA